LGKLHNYIDLVLFLFAMFRRKSVWVSWWKGGKIIWFSSQGIFMSCTQKASIQSKCCSFVIIFIIHCMWTSEIRTCSAQHRNVCYINGTVQWT